MDYAIVLAAGKGTRMKTENPKCAFPLLKTPMIEYIISSLTKTKIDEIVVVVGHKKEVFEEMLNERVSFATQSEQLGTGHAVLQAKNNIKDVSGNTFILCGDMPLVDEMILNNLYEYHMQNNLDITVLSTIMDDPTSYGRIVRNEKGSLECIVEEKEATLEIKEIKEINTGLYCVKSSILFDLLSQVKNDNAKSEYYLTDIIEIAKTKNMNVSAYCDNNSYKFIGVNDLYTLSIVESYLQDEINRMHMLNGVNIVSPKTVLISKDVKIESGTTIYPNTCIYGKTVIKNGTVVGPNSEISNSIIGSNSSVVHSTVFDSEIGSKTTVGPFAHLRMHTILGDKIRLGNFVELKNSKIANETKISHLTYIGDTECGSNVNWGCGCVTVNYDGVNKNKTIIGDNVFIGCNTNLIAPISIGNGAYIAAGSTLTESLENDDFAIARAKQVTKHEYAKKYAKY